MTIDGKNASFLDANHECSTSDSDLVQVAMVVTAGHESTLFSV